MFDDHRDVLLAPVISEKSYGLLDENKYTFVVHPDANKTEIKIAVEKVFDVKVTDVNTLNRQGKRKRTRFGCGKRKDTKRAIVSLARGRPHRHLRRTGRLTGERYIRTMTDDSWASASTSRRLRAAVARASPTSSRSPGPTPEKSLVRPLHKRAAVTTPAASPPGTRVAGTSAPTGVIDFRRNDKDGVPAKVAHIEYDPNRTARIALLHYADGEKRYILAPRTLQQGDRIENGPGADIKPGNSLPLRNIPVGTVDPRDRAAPRRRRQDRPLGRRQRPAGRQGRPLRAAADALRRDPQRRRALPRHRRRGGQRRAVATSTGARPAGCGGRASARPSAAWR